VAAERRTDYAAVLLCRRDLALTKSGNCEFGVWPLRGGAPSGSDTGVTSPHSLGAAHHLPSQLPRRSHLNTGESGALWKRLVPEVCSGQLQCHPRSGGGGPPCQTPGIPGHSARADAWMATAGCGSALGEPGGHRQGGQTKSSTICPNKRPDLEKAGRPPLPPELKQSLQDDRTTFPTTSSEPATDEISRPATPGALRWSGLVRGSALRSGSCLSLLMFRSAGSSRDRGGSVSPCLLPGAWSTTLRCSRVVMRSVATRGGSKDQPPP